MFWRTPRPRPVRNVAPPAPAPAAEPEPPLPPTPPAPPVTPPPARPTLDPAYEWHQALTLVQDLDATLLKLRLIALPLLIAGIAIGAGLSTMLDRFSVPLELSVALVIAAAVMVLAIGLLACFSVAPSPRYRVRPWEVIPFVLLTVCIAVWAYLICDNDPRSIGLAGPILAAGGLFLLLVYLMDRCYFANLRLGAQYRVDALEDVLYEDASIEADRRIGLHYDVSSSAPRWAATLLPIALYFLPIFILINAGLAIVAYGRADAPRSVRCTTGITLGIRGGQLRLGIDRERAAAGCPQTSARTLSSLRGLSGSLNNLRSLSRLLPNISGLQGLEKLLPNLIPMPNTQR